MTLYYPDCHKVRPFSLWGANRVNPYVHCVWCNTILRVASGFATRAQMHRYRCAQKPKPENICTCTTCH